MVGKDAYYFTHDSNARNDPKILAMRSVYGSEGYGWFWMIIEMLREQENYVLPVNHLCYEALALQFGCQPAQIEKFITACCNDFKDRTGGLLCRDDNYIWSTSLCRRMAVLDQKREKARLSAYQRWNNDMQYANALPPHSERKAIAMPTQSEGNASKVKYSKVNNIKEEEEKNNIIQIDDEKKEAARELLKKNVSPSNYRTWFEGLQLLGVYGRDFYICCPNDFVAQELDKNRRGLIENVLRKLSLIEEGQKIFFTTMDGSKDA